ncbi:Ribosome production factor 1 [Cichlidogyrus casuarinus]|uniref:Ribosome production factor 1 n=1 Tax=Cichlidogyrus casuarinus TaxID=1844966 RepID=A0ABD2PNU7_9PLAT
MRDIKETTKHHERHVKQLVRVKKGKDQRKRRLERKKTGLPGGIPQTLETLRVPDETTFEKEDVDIATEEDADEFSRIYSGEIEPKILITYSDRACAKTMGFCKELTRIFPNSTFIPRYHKALKKVIPKAIEKGYTAFIIVNEDAKKINSIVLSFMPQGPTLTFRISNIKCSRQFRKNKGKDAYLEEDVTPQLLTTRFSTRLGRRVDRCLGALFPSDSRRQVPLGHNRVVLFHNQRDFIFCRHYRYIHRDGDGPVKQNDRGAVLTDEVGPRFTLKLKSIQRDTFDTKFGQFEWLRKRQDMNTSRRSFVL